MFSLVESNVGSYVNAGTGAAAAATTAPFMRSRESHNQYAPVMSYTQMLRMSIEEEGGAEDMGSSINCSREPYCSYLQGAAMEAKEERGEEGFAENDYDLTCLTLGLGRPASDVISTRVELGQSNFVEANPLAGRSSNSSGVTRTCTLCGTSKTPLWRSGPMGAKSLCNACGIRSKKAKKIAAALNDEEQTAANFGQKKGIPLGPRHLQAGAAATGTKSKAVKRKTMITKGGEMEMAKKKKQQLPQLYVNVCSPVKTETSSCVTTSPGTPSPCSTQRKPFTSSLFCPPHPKDEEQAAFLLMALSCGLVLAN